MKRTLTYSLLLLFSLAPFAPATVLLPENMENAYLQIDIIGASWRVPGYYDIWEDNAMTVLSDRLVTRNVGNIARVILYSDPFIFGVADVPKLADLVEVGGAPQRVPKHLAWPIFNHPADPVFCSDGDPGPCPPNPPGYSDSLRVDFPFGRPPGIIVRETVVIIPEPSSAMLMVAGIGLAALRSCWRIGLLCRRA